ncbi:NAD(P)/FAD-dependent oxidoreductase [bacterium]|nr:MAG: NAD(P)/FAD-dependent oxidoreductase [bacterium]
MDRALRAKGGARLVPRRNRLRRGRRADGAVPSRGSDRRARSVHVLQPRPPRVPRPGGGDLLRGDLYRRVLGQRGPHTALRLQPDPVQALARRSASGLCQTLNLGPAARYNLPMSNEAHYDVAIIGGGPSGSTTGTLLKKYAPHLKVLVLERETFPRDHIGESLLPPTGPILHEMGVWDRVEAADFPIKIGATYKWGKNPELWDFEFIQGDTFRDEPRPGKFEGQRTRTSFQVERARFDEILLDRAAEVGCEVRQNTKVARVLRDGDRIEGLTLDSGETIVAKHYVDASGNAGILRKALEIPTDYPTTLRNIAIWDYWQDTGWAVEIGTGGTRIQVMSLGWGWIWFIPMGPTRTSIGLVVPADYYKESGLRPAELYARAIAEEPRIAELTRDATREEKLESTKDWSFLAEQHFGENWFLVGECAGFADPILSAGVTIAQVSARQLAYTIAEMERPAEPGKAPLDPDWLREQFEFGQKERILTHIRFGDYWYTANAQFTDLQEFTTTLARDAGLDLSPQKAWAWIAQGGFINQDLRIGMGGCNINTVLKVGEFLSDLDVEMEIERNNVLRLNLDGAVRKNVAVYHEGRVHREDCYVRGERILPLFSQILMLVDLLPREPRYPYLMRRLQEMARTVPFVAQALPVVPEALEAMIQDGWIIASYDPRLPKMNRTRDGRTIHANRDPEFGLISEPTADEVPVT